MDIAVDLLPVDVNVTASHLLWAAQFAAALPYMGSPPDAEPGPDKLAHIGGYNDVSTELQARPTFAHSIQVLHAVLQVLRADCQFLESRVPVCP